MHTATITIDGHPHPYKLECITYHGVHTAAVCFVVGFYHTNWAEPVALEVIKDIDDCLENPGEYLFDKINPFDAGLHVEIH